MPDAATDKVLRRWKRDTEAYAAANLKVLSKAGKLVPLRFNEAQKRLMASCDEQLERVGRVRKVVDKGRQVGVSTATAARYYRDAHLKPGTRVQVIAHRQSATKNLAAMTTRYHDHLTPAMRVPLLSRNQTELKFIHQSSYTLSTAGDKADPGATGRSETGTRLHASEFAYWIGAGARIQGLYQALADLPGTEGIVESTAQGQANAFYDLWRQAEAGVTDWEPVFIPWFVEPTYTRAPPPGWQCSTDQEMDGILPEKEYRDAHDLTLGQMYWRRLKIGELSVGSESGLLAFAREYPATAYESFLVSAETAFLNAYEVAMARERYIDFTQVGMAPLVVGVDPATSHGTDLTCICRRRRMKAYGLEAHSRMSEPEILSMLWKIWQDERPQWFVIDRSGVGDSIYDALVARGVPCVGVYFGGKPTDRQRYGDKRAELYSRAIPWIADGDLPDDPELAQDLLAQKRLPVEKRELRLMNKHALVGYGLRSPDRSDAFVLTLEIIDDEAGAGLPGSVSVKGWRDLPSHVVG